MRCARRLFSARRRPRASLTAIRVSQVLSDERQRYAAMVKADGSLIAGPHHGSIHRVGALVQGAEACNGWTFWHTNKRGRLAPIDLLRGEVRQQMEKLSA